MKRGTTTQANGYLWAGNVPDSVATRQQLILRIDPCPDDDDMSVLTLSWGTEALSLVMPVASLVRAVDDFAQDKCGVSA